MLEQILAIWGAFQAPTGGYPEPAVFVPMHVHIYAYNATAGLATCTGSLQYCIYLWDPSVLCAVAIPTYLINTLLPNRALGRGRRGPDQRCNG